MCVPAYFFFLEVVMDDTGTEEKKLSWLQENLELQWGNPPLGSGHHPRRLLEAVSPHFCVVVDSSLLLLSKILSHSGNTISFGITNLYSNIA